jgi:DNA-binding MarR family transcriptional regulator
MKDYNDQIAARIEAVMITMHRASFRDGLAHGQSLRPTMFLMLNILAKHFSDPKAEPITASELAKRMHISPAATTQILDILECKKLVGRVKSETDRRVTFIVPTRKGRSILKNCGRINSRDRHAGMMKELLEYLGDKDSAELARLMERISEFMSNKHANDKNEEKSK